MQARIFNLILVCCYLTILFLVFQNFVPNAIFFANDQSTDFIVARELLNGDVPLLGPPSHIGGRHPGPLYYWFVTLVYLLGGKEIHSAIIFTSIFKCISVVTIFYLLKELLPTSLFRFRWHVAAIGVLLCLVQLPYISLLRMHWQSNYLFIVGPMAVASSFLVLRHGPSCIPFFILGLSLLFQSHLSSSPVIAGLCSIVALRLFTNRGNWAEVPNKGRRRFFGVLALVVTAVLWSPVVYHELTYPSNFGGLFTLHSNPGIKAGLVASGKMLAAFLLHFAAGIPYGSFPKVLWLISLGLILFLVVRYLRAADSVKRWQFAAACAPLIVTAVVLSRFRLPLYPHYYNSSVYFPAFLAGILLSQAIADISSRRKLFVLIPCAVFVGLFGYSATKGVFNSYEKYKGPAPRPYYTLGFFQDAGREIPELMRARGDDSQVTVISSLNVKISRNGFAVYLPPGYDPNLEYKNFFHEMEYFRKNASKSSADRAIFVSCPHPHTALRRDMKVALSKEWVIEEQIPENSCKTCGECLLVLLKKRDSLD